ncbi:MAG: VOC family protein [Phyllobacteriaceae bacterium]|nr:VOC family protein [Phyllobacteriaceae bacterium]
MKPDVRTCLWFEKDGEAAARLYTSLLPESRIESSFHPEPGKPPLVVDFVLAGVPYQILNGGPMFTQSEAASISVTVADQAEADRLWNALTADGGREGQCGWLKDRWGVSWQIVPQAVLDMLKNDDRLAAGRAMAAMMTMHRLDIDTMRKAFDGE